MDELREEDEYFNRSVLRDDSQALTNYYSDYGYAFAEADYRIDKRSEDKRIDVVYQVSKHEKVYIGRVTIEGNTKTRDNVIRREMRLTDGELFSGSKLRRSNERLTKLDYFESVDVQTVPTDDPNELDLRVKVKEKATGMLAGGVGYSTYAKFFVAVKLQERNLFGSGYSANISGEFSGSSTRYSVGVTNPRWNDTPLSVGMDLYWDTSDYEEFDKDTTGGRLRFAYPIGEYTNAFWYYRLDQYTIDDVDDDASDEIKDIEGNNWSSTFTIGAKRDTTDTRLNPSKGTINTLSVEVGGGILMGDDEFIKPIWDSSYYYPLQKNHVLHWHGQVGFVFENFGGDDVPVFERFYLGGINTVRGYPGSKISPLDDDSDDFIGGNKEFFTNFEYIWTFDEELGLALVPFFDMGVALDNGDWDYLGELKKSVGLELRWFSPFGPLRLSYGYALDSVHEQGSNHKFEFSMGQFF
jgi:outer membrane protein insertion porin family